MALPPEATRAKVARRKPAKVRRTSSSPPSFPSFVPSRPGETPAEQATSQRKRAKRVQVSATRRRVDRGAPIVVRRRQKKAKEQAPGEYYASLGQAVEHAADRQRKGLDLASERVRGRSLPDKVARVVVDVGGKAAHVAGEGITGAGGAVSAFLGAGDEIGDAISEEILGHKVKRERGAAKVSGDILRNLGPDAAELAVTTPSSIAKLGVTAATDPARVPGMLAEPYGELIDDPIGFVSEHPVSAALMVSPAVRMPGRVAGKVARKTKTGQRLAGRERAPAQVAGTPLLVHREGPRGLVSGLVSKRRENAREGPVEITGSKAEDIINSRVDEFYGSVETPHIRKVADRARAQSEERGHTEHKAQMHMKGSINRARRTVNERFAEEFGDSDIAKARLNKHRVVGSSPATPARALRVTRRMFTGSVLPYSTKWMAGQLTEAALRSLVSGTGPLSYARARKLARQHPELAEELFARAAPGGFGAETLAKGGAPTRTIAEEFKGAGGKVERTAQRITKAGAFPGLPALRALNNKARGFIFEKAAGGIERRTQTAMLGAELKKSGLMDRHILGLSDKAIAEAAKGLKATENQVALAEQVRRSYGQYTHFSPEMRGAIMHWTPFLPWFINTGRFLLHTLPVEHPMWAAVAADLDAATEEWKVKNRLSTRAGKEDKVPAYLMGSYPVGDKGQVTRVGKFLPFAPGEIIEDPLAGAADLVLPQFGSALDVARGRNPFGGPRFDDPSTGERVGGAALELGKAFVPGVGVGLGVAKQGVKRQFIPGYPTKPPKVKRKKRKVRRQSGLAGFDGGLSGGGLSGGLTLGG